MSPPPCSEQESLLCDEVYVMMGMMGEDLFWRSSELPEHLLYGVDGRSRRLQSDDMAETD